MSMKKITLLLTALIFLILLQFWDFSEIESVLIEIALLVHLTDYLVKNVLNCD